MTEEHWHELIKKLQLTNDDEEEFKLFDEINRRLKIYDELYSLWFEDDADLGIWVKKTIPIMQRMNKR